MSFPVNFEGRLGADPEVTFAANGTATARMRIATNTRRLVEGEWQDVDTSWWQVTAFGRLAELAGDHLRKGQAVMVSGKIKQREWEKDGVKRVSADIVADKIAVVLRGEAQKLAEAPASKPATSAWPDESTPF